MKSYEQVAMNILLGKTQVEEQTEEQVDEAAVHPDAIHVKPVKMGGQTKYKVHAVGKNYSDGIKVGEHLSDSELDDFSEMGGRIKHMKEQVKPEVEKSFPATGVNKNPPMKGVSTMPKDKERRGPMPAGSMKEESEELDEMGPGKLPRIDKKVENEYGDKLMKDFLAKGGQVQQVKSPALPKNRNRMVARGSLSGAERTVTRSGGKSYTSRMEEVEEDYDQLIEEKNAFEIEVPEYLVFADYLNAAKQFAESHEDAIRIADHFWTNQDESIVIEAFMRSDIEDRVKMHQKAGNEVTLPKYSTKDGKPHAEYIVTDKDSGKKTKYIHHGSMRRVERMN